MPCKNAIKKTPRKKAARNERRKATKTAAAAGSAEREADRGRDRETEQGGAGRASATLHDFGASSVNKMLQSS